MPWFENSFSFEASNKKADLLSGFAVYFILYRFKRTIFLFWAFA